MGKVEEYLKERIETYGAVHLSLIDPFEQKPEEAGKIALAASEGGTDAILVGGSIGAQGELLDLTVKAIKENSNLPVILFPGNVGTITRYADAIYFMILMNSRDPYFITKAQILGAPLVKKFGLEPIPVAYILLEPGGAAGWVGDANLVPRDDPEIACACALAGEFLGAHIVITDSGSGAPSPAPPFLIKAIKSVLTVPYFYAGGVRTAEQAKEIVLAGADGIQVGTAIEHLKDMKEVTEKVRKMVTAIREAGKEKLRKGR
ncbi:MAG: geranylgeranylglyceryl/heptaprenylglyceryl phosphate synthase [Candidatus Baldrarchaeia archaeon]